MSRYVLVQNNEVIGGIQPLPKSWNNISNFDVLESESLIQHGWYPYEEDEVILGENEAILRWDIVIEPTRVVKKTITRQLSGEEIEHRNIVLIQKKWDDIRNKRNLLLSECDWIILEDSPVGNKEAWKLYRQKLRDITKSPSPEEAIWPPKPLIAPIITSPIESIQQETPPIDETINQEVDPNLGD